MIDGRAAILQVLSRHAFRVGNERELQDAIAGVLTAAGLPLEREVDLGDAGRIDFLVGTVGVELKVDGSDSSVIRQLHRYAQHPRVRSLILVTTRSRHARIAALTFGAPLSVHHVALAW